MRDFLGVARALGDEARVRALMALREEELCLCQVIDLLRPLAPSTVSKHMAVLLEAGLVRRRKKGRWHFYRLAGADASPAVRKGLRWALQSLPDDPRVVRDARTVRLIRKKPREELSACYRT